VVDDDGAVRRVTQRVLADHGYRVMVAASRHDAIQAARACAERINALVADVVTLGMQRPGLPERIRGFQPGISLLYVSGYPEGLLDAPGVLEQGIGLLENHSRKPRLLCGCKTDAGG
jgi:two-component system cell cycle sensor histidine kinase/response regulator CckA